MQTTYERRVIAGGYVQHREVDLTTMHRGPWKFHLTGFLARTCSILMHDGTHSEIPIDGNNRITVNGRKFSESHWTH